MKSFLHIGEQARLLKKFISIVVNTDDTPELIRKIAENRHYLLYCGLIVKPGRNAEYIDLQKALVSEPRRRGVSLEHVKKKLMPVALALGLCANDTGFAQADYYQILEVPPFAAADDIKKAYRSKARTLHPDAETGNKNQFISIHDAYSVLSNRELREQYDKSRKQAEKGFWLEARGGNQRQPSDRLPSTTRRFTLSMAAIVALLVGITWVVDIIDREMSLEGGIRHQKDLIDHQLEAPQENVAEKATETEKRLAVNDDRAAKKNADAKEQTLMPVSQQEFDAKEEIEPLKEIIIKKSIRPEIEKRQPAPAQAQMASKKIPAPPAAIEKNEGVSQPVVMVVKTAAAESVEMDIPVETASPQESTQTAAADVSEQIRKFLNSYCSAYEKKELDKFMGFFTDTALENGKPVKNLLPTYRKNFEMLDRVAYKIEFTDYAIDLDSREIQVNGKFKLDWCRKGEKQLNHHNGSIKMNLYYDGHSVFRVDRLSYEFKD